MQEGLSLKRTHLPVEMIEGEPLNPNEMSDRQFNMLVKNIDETGITENIVVRPVGPDKYRVVSGHHRLEAAKHLSFADVPVTIIEGMKDEDAAKAQMVRMNIIKGKMSPQKFVALYKSLAGQYSDEVAAEMFGFVESEAFAKLIAKTKAGLPSELKKTFEESEKEIKTIKDLSKVLNGLFSKYGATLKHNYMVFDYRGKEAVWIRCNPSDLQDVYELGNVCQQAEITLDAAVSWLFQSVVKNPAWKKELLASIEKHKGPTAAGTPLPVLDTLNSKNEL
jgi:ParB/RepB/Spo0J family partition protein